MGAVSEHKYLRRFSHLVAERRRAYAVVAAMMLAVVVGTVSTLILETGSSSLQSIAALALMGLVAILLPKLGRGGDLLSPPILLGGMYLFCFALGALDVVLARYYCLGPRLRDLFYDFHGISFLALFYLLIGYLLFVTGYHLHLGKSIGRLLSTGTMAMNSRRASILTVVMFSTTFGFLVLYVQQVGYGRLQGSGQSRLENLALLGEMSLVPYALGVWRCLSARRFNNSRTSKWGFFFTWGVMLPLQVVLSVLTGMRTRLLTVVSVALAGYHYGYRRLSLRSVVIGLLVMATIIMPIMSLLRSSTQHIYDWNLEYAWESIMGRTSALEGFTVTFEHLDSAPSPDPLWLMVVSGLIPRLVWPNKPVSSWIGRFSTWASGSPVKQLAPALPGELLLYFGYIGGLLAMLVLGIFWRVLFEALLAPGKRPSASAFLYILVLPLLVTSIEQGLVIPYSVVIRFLAVGTVALLFVRE